MFSPDGPIKTHSEDILGRAAFAQSLADAVLSYNDKACLVTSIFGPWGSGKSSLINLVLERIEQCSLLRPKAERPIVVRFNPWNFSDQNQLTAQFFQQLSIALRRKDSAKEAHEAGEKLEIYAQFFAPVALIADQSAAWLAIAAFQKLLSAFGKTIKKWGQLNEKSVGAVKAEINGLLEKMPQRLSLLLTTSTD